jgi:hypothetical protein
LHEAVLKEFRDTCGNVCLSSNFSHTGNSKLIFMYIKYTQLYIHIYIFVYIRNICSCVVRVLRQYMFHLEEFHTLFSANFFTQTLSCVSNAANSCCREQYDERGDRTFRIDSLNGDLNPICHLLPLLGGRRIFHISRIRVKTCQFVIPQHAWCENS